MRESSLRVSGISFPDLAFLSKLRASFLKVASTRLFGGDLACFETEQNSARTGSSKHAVIQPLRKVILGLAQSAFGTAYSAKQALTRSDS